jgi:RHS repeat-associated protein
LQQTFDWGSSNNNGNLRGATEQNGGPGYPGFLTFQQSYAYDALNRLSSVSDTGYSRSFGYDRYGNRWVSADSGTVGMTGLTPTANVYDANSNRLQGAPYDPVGNLTAYSDDKLIYDAENRLTIASETGFSTENYTYDAEGRRVMKSTQGTSTVYVYDVFGHLTAEYNAGATASSPCGTCYLTWDYLGSTRMVTDSTAILIARHDYLPFGGEISNGLAGRDRNFDSGDTINQKFTGKERDQETGLDWFSGLAANADGTDPNSNTQPWPSIFTTGRHYSSALGRFTSADIPLWDQDPTDPQSWNLYSYVRNNPLSNIDPNGRSCLTLTNDNSDEFQGDDGDGLGCPGAGVNPSQNGQFNPSKDIQPDQVNVNAQQTSWLDYAWTISTNEIPTYDPNDQPLSNNTQQIFTLAYNQTAHGLGCVGLGWAVQGGAIAASAQTIPKAFSQGGTSGTSLASKLLSGVKLGTRLPTPVGTPGTATFAWRASADLGRIAGRYLPYVGTIAGAAATYACLGSKP